MCRWTQDPIQWFLTSTHSGCPKTFMRLSLHQSPESPVRCFCVYGLRAFTCLINQNCSMRSVTLKVNYIRNRCIFLKAISRTRIEGILLSPDKVLIHLFTCPPLWCLPAVCFLLSWEQTSCFLLPLSSGFDGLESSLSCPSPCTSPRAAWHPCCGALCGGYTRGHLMP